MMLCGCFSVFGGEQMVPVCQMSMMTRSFVGTSFVVLCRLPMMFGGVLVVFSGLFMTLRAFVLCHFFSPC